MRIIPIKHGISVLIALLAAVHSLDAEKTVREEEVCKPPLMTTTSQTTVVGAVTAVSELTDLLQSDRWTDGGRPVCGDKSVPHHGVL